MRELSAGPGALGDLSVWIEVRRMEEGCKVWEDHWVKENLKNMSRLGLGRRGGVQGGVAGLGKSSQTGGRKEQGEWVECVRGIEMGRAWGSLALRA